MQSPASHLHSASEHRPDTSQYHDTPRPGDHGAQLRPLLLTAVSLVRGVDAVKLAVADLVARHAAPVPALEHARPTQDVAPGWDRGR